MPCALTWNQDYTNPTPASLPPPFTAFDVCRGSCAGRDINLENFSVSNGGKDLIADASVIMAYGRRYGLIGRNGTGVFAQACIVRFSNTEG